MRQREISKNASYIQAKNKVYFLNIIHLFFIGCGIFFAVLSQLFLLLFSYSLLSSLSSFLDFLSSGFSLISQQFASGTFRFLFMDVLHQYTLIFEDVTFKRTINLFCFKNLNRQLTFALQIKGMIKVSINFFSVPISLQ